MSQLDELLDEFSRMRGYTADQIKATKIILGNMIDDDDTYPFEYRQVIREMIGEYGLPLDVSIYNQPAYGVFSLDLQRLLRVHYEGAITEANATGEVSEEAYQLAMWASKNALWSRVAGVLTIDAVYSDAQRLQALEMRRDPAKAAAYVQSRIDKIRSRMKGEANG